MSMILNEHLAAFDFTDQHRNGTNITTEANSIHVDVLHNGDKASSMSDHDTKEKSDRKVGKKSPNSDDNHPEQPKLKKIKVPRPFDISKYVVYNMRVGFYLHYC